MTGDQAARKGGRFSPASVTARIPKLAALGPDVLASFPVRHFPQARVLWLNDRWFLDAGVDSRCPGTRQEIRGWLLDMFAVYASHCDGAAEASASVLRRLYADRYGATGGGRHGGSGRCGALGDFNAKGVGRTPLATLNVDRYHRNGCLSLHEGIREAINAEIAHAELPFGAVPVIGIIDTDAAFKPDPEAPAERRAIVIRPNFVRPSHFERSIFFGSSGRAAADQYIDALRVRDAIAFTTGDEKLRRAANIAFNDLREMYLRFARQVGEARAHRLWQGQFLNSNLSVDGALVDFGAFRSVQSWQGAVGQPGQIFGQDSIALARAIESVCFYFRKYAPRDYPVPDPRALNAEAARAVDEAFGQGCAGILPIDPKGRPEVSADIAALYLDYFKHQQRTRFQLGRHARSVWRRPWLTDAFGPEGTKDDVGTKESAVARALADLVRAGVEGTDVWEKTAMHALWRWLRPRPLLYYEIALPRAKAFVERLTGTESDADKVANYINSCISKSRRVWRSVPKHLEIRGQVTNLYSSALYCFDRARNESFVWVEGRGGGSGMYAFAQTVPWNDMEGMDAQREGAIVRFLVPIRSVNVESDIAIEIGASTLRIPRPLLVY